MASNSRSLSLRCRKSRSHQYESPTTSQSVKKPAVMSTTISLHLTLAAHPCLFNKRELRMRCLGVLGISLPQQMKQKKNAFIGWSSSRMFLQRAVAVAFERKSLGKMIKRVGCGHVCPAHGERRITREDPGKVRKRASTQVRGGEQACKLAHQDSQNRQQCHHMSQTTPLKANLLTKASLSLTKKQQHDGKLSQSSVLSATLDNTTWHMACDAQTEQFKTESDFVCRVSIQC